MSETRYTIGELAERAGVTARTVRFYTAEGLLPQPETDGRYALYTVEHLDRLRLIGRLKDAYLPLGEIRRRIEGLDQAGVRAMLSELEQHTESAASPTPGALPAHAPAPPQTRDSASAYIARLLSTQKRSDPASGGAAGILPGRTRIQSAPTEQWQRTILAPGVELHVREPLPPDLQTLVKQLVEQARRFR